MTVEVLEVVELEPRNLEGKWPAMVPMVYHPAGRKPTGLLWAWVLLVLLDVAQ